MRESVQATAATERGLVLEAREITKRFLQTVDDVVSVQLQVGILRPELFIHSENSVEKVAQVEVAFRERVLLEMSEREWQEMGQRDLLPDHETKVLDREISEGLLSQVVASHNKTS